MNLTLTEPRLSNWVMGRRWYIARPQGGKEFKAQAYAEQRNWKVFMPWCVKTRKNRGGRVMGVHVPFIRGYLFATGDRFETNLDDLECRFYFNRLLGPREDPYQIPDTDPVMHELFRRADVDGFVKEPDQPLFTYGEGDEIQVIAGPLQGQETKIIELTKTQIKIWTPLMGGSFAYVPHEQVKLKATAFCA